MTQGKRAHQAMQRQVKSDNYTMKGKHMKEAKILGVAKIKKRFGWR